MPAATPVIQGVCDRRFSAVRDAFTQNFATMGEVGASVAIYVDGRCVADLWGGWMDEERTRPWQKDTIVNVYSCTKAFAAMCAHMLVERGKLDLDAPVAKYWPEFAQAGKERIPVRWLLSHQAGLPAVRERLPLGSHCRWDVMAGGLARSEPWWTPGTQHGYHVMTYGWLVGEVVNRSAGKSIGTFFRDEVAGPLDADFHMGIGPEHDARIATILYAPPAAPGEESVLMQRIKEKGSMTYMAVMNPKDMMARGTVNTRAWRAAEIPAAGGHSNARAMARVYGALARGGEIDGTCILRPETINAAIVEQCKGLDAVLGNESRYGLGFMLPYGDNRWGPNKRVFGHAGAGGSVAFADLDAGLGFGYAMNQMLGGMGSGDPRWRSMIDAAYAALR